VKPDLDVASAVEDALAHYDTAVLGARLARDGVVELPSFLPMLLERGVEDEVESLLAAHGRQLDARVASTAHTPRKYLTVPRDEVIAHAPLIANIYAAPAVRTLLARMTGSEVITLPYEPEQVVVNEMRAVGDTHGWHWDDYSFSLVWVVHAPRANNGGHVEYIDGTSWDKQAPLVAHYLETRPVHELAVPRGAAYVLLGRRVLHRVAPFVQDDLRRIVCFSYASALERELEIDHGSMTDLYG